MTIEQVLNKKEQVKTPAPVKPATAPTNLAEAQANPVLPPSKFITHHVKAGVNPLVDAAAYLFSVTGKLKQLKTYRHLSKLNKELVTEINTFQDAAKAQGYSSEYILVSRYALCATLDDIITNTPWGSQGQWDNHSLLAVFNQESLNHERFFMILERIMKDSSLYIDLMEFMYICLSLGFKGNYRSTEFSQNQIEQITHSLYRHIRAHHGDFNKSLSPYPFRAPTAKTPTKKAPVLLVLLLTATVILSLFIGLSYMLDAISNQAYKELMHIGKSLLYETHNI
jgi:type VI secretion system protein ImpK